MTKKWCKNEEGPDKTEGKLEKRGQQKTHEIAKK